MTVEVQVQFLGPEDDFVVIEEWDTDADGGLLHRSSVKTRTEVGAYVNGYVYTGRCLVIREGRKNT